jgi:hypothetical protein
MNRIRRALLLSGLTIMLSARTAEAWDAATTGVIVVLHLNSEPGLAPTRGVCVQMVPALPASGYGWACLRTANPLYKEITALLYAAYLSGKTCTLNTSVDPSALLLNEIKIAQCQ